MYFFKTFFYSCHFSQNSHFSPLFHSEMQSASPLLCCFAFDISCDEYDFPAHYSNWTTEKRLISQSEYIFGTGVGRGMQAFGEG